LAPTPARQCLNLGIDGSVHTPKILVSTKNAVIPVWPNECNLQRVFSAIKKLLKKFGFPVERVVAAAKSQIALHQNLR
jgi:hypothetical protein